MAPRDLARVAALTGQLGYPVEEREMARRHAAIADRDDHLVLVATDDADAPIGWIHVMRHLVLEASDQALIGGLVVDERHRSGGVGAELVAAAEAWARDGGATTIVVRSRSTRTAAHRFYQRIGYVETKRSHVFEKPLV